MESLHAPGEDDAFTPEFMVQVAAFAHAMDTRAVDSRRVRRPHANASREELQQLSEPVTEQFLRELKENPDADGQLRDWAMNSPQASVMHRGSALVGKTKAFTNDALYAAVCGFCRVVGQKHPPQKRTFLAALKAAGWTEQRDSKTRGWLPPWHQTGDDAKALATKVVPLTGPRTWTIHPHPPRCLATVDAGSQRSCARREAMSVRLRKWKTKEGRVQEAWWVDVKYQPPHGRVERVRKASPINTRRGAEEYERQVRHALLLTGTFGKEKQSEPGRVLTLGEFVPRFITYSENNNKHSSVVTKRQLLDDHLLPVFGNTPLDALGPVEIEDCKAAMRKKPVGIPGRKGAPSKEALRKRKGSGVKLLSLKSINNVLTVLHKLLALAQEQGVLQHVPRVKLFKTDKPAFDFLTFEEAERLLNAAEPEWRTWVLLALKTGL